MNELIGLSFDEAVRHVLENKSLAYTFSPFEKKGRVVGGLIYAVKYDLDENEICIDYLDGYFGDFGGAEDFYSLDDIPEDAKALKYQIADLKTDRFFWGDIIEIIIKLLMGLPESEAYNEYPCPECDQILLRTGQANKCDKCK